MQMTEELTRDEVHAAVDRAVEELLAAAGLTAPPIDAIALAQGKLGMVVCLDRGQQQRGRAQRTAGKRQIYLRPEPTEERHQWTVAHEIGEHLKPALLERLGVAPAATRPMLGESLANLFANRLLVPTCWLRDDARGLDYDVLELKRRYRTASHEVLAWRLLDLPEPCAMTIIDNGSIYRRKSNAFRLPRELAPAEKDCQRWVNKHGKPGAVRASGWTVQGWPVHQADWQREILRSVVDEADVLDPS
jgi:Zn-dependent peptidase ImmA (M78 family)